MLGRAKEEYRPVKKEPSSQPFPTSTPTPPNGTLDDWKSKPKSSQTIGGFAGVKNTAMPLSRHSSLGSAYSFQSSSTTNGIKRSASQINGGLATALKPGSFQDDTKPIDLTQEDRKVPVKSETGSNTISNIGFDLNMDDFPDDSELDLDEEFPTTLPAASTYRAPLQKSSVSTQNFQSALPPVKKNFKSSQAPASSAESWSSSPPQHKVPPAAVLQAEGKARELELFKYPELPKVDDNPRPAKRRTLPWESGRAEAATARTPAPKRAEAGAARTPAPKVKSEPWNTSASAIKEQKQVHRTKNQKAAGNKMTVEEMQTAIASHSKVSPEMLSDEQTKVLDLVVEKKASVFFTGSAGTGKSVLMRAIIKALKKKYAKEQDRVAVTASTGLAACNIGGQTLHSFGGIGLGKEDANTIVKKIRRNAKAKNRWLRTSVLIIDEVSMVDGDLFDKLEEIARIMRNNGRPFGGIQLVVTGDFFQLPPVPDFSSKPSKFAFDAATWSTSIRHTILLKTIFRQKDPVFANMLNELRLGNISNQTVETFKKLSRPIKAEDELEATELFPTRNEVDNANAYRMRSLQGGAKQFNAIDTPGSEKDEKRRENLLKNMLAPPKLTLKKGAQVMLIKNLDEHLVNGSIGKVISFMNEKTFEMYEHDSEIFEQGENKDMDESFRKRKDKLNAMLHQDLIGDTSKDFPVVTFPLPDGSSRTILVQPETWKVELPSGEMQVQRQQVPLILAWALSIHKAQGQTLERVKVDLRKIFEKGQAYVALSRATSQEGLQVLGFDKSKVMAHPRVAQFYQSLYSADKAGPKNAGMSVADWATKGAAASSTKSGMVKSTSTSTKIQAGGKGGVKKNVMAIDSDDEDALQAMHA